MKFVSNVVENCYWNTNTVVVLSFIFYTHMYIRIEYLPFSDHSVYFNRPGINRLYLLSLVFAFEKKD